jgi:hypothetical protein
MLTDNENEDSESVTTTTTTTTHANATSTSSTASPTTSFTQKEVARIDKSKTVVTAFKDHTLLYKQIISQHTTLHHVCSVANTNINN